MAESTQQPNLLSAFFFFFRFFGFFSVSEGMPRSGVLVEGVCRYPGTAVSSNADTSIFR